MIRVPAKFSRTNQFWLIILNKKKCDLVSYVRNNFYHATVNVCSVSEIMGCDFTISTNRYTNKKFRRTFELASS